VTIPEKMATERDGDGGEVQNVVKPNKLPANYNHFVKSH
jgi:hypothetical protein